MMNDNESNAAARLCHALGRYLDEDVGGASGEALNELCKALEVCIHFAVRHDAAWRYDAFDGVEPSSSRGAALAVCESSVPGSSCLITAMTCAHFSAT